MSPESPQVPLFSVGILAHGDSRIDDSPYGLRDPVFFPLLQRSLIWYLLEDFIEDLLLLCQSSVLIHIQVLPYFPILKFPSSTISLVARPSNPMVRTQFETNLSTTLYTYFGYG